MIADYKRCRQSLRRVECTSVPVAFDALWSGTIEFGSISSLNGFWYGKAAMSFPIFQKVTVAVLNDQDYWGSQLTAIGRDITEENVRPSLTLRLPATGRGSLHQRIRGKVSLEVTYPVRSGGGDTFTNETATRARNLTFFVVGPKELIALERVAPKGHWSPIWKWLGLVLLGVVAVGVLQKVVRAITRRVHRHPLLHH